MSHKEQAKQFYKSTAWQKCRQSYIYKVHGLCERCDRAGTIVHHKEYITVNNINDPQITLNHDNLELLCHDCHNKEHFSKSATRDDVMFNESGELIPK